MPRCPDGHDSSDPAYCDACGLAIADAAAPAAAPIPAPQPEPSPEPVSPDHCHGCGEPVEGRFCEECGFDNDLDVPAEVTASQRERAAQKAGWTAVARPDREWFDQVRARNGPDAGDLDFPRYGPEMRFELTGSQMSIGRRSRSRGTDPDIDLGAADPGISARHALLLARQDGGWDVVDLKSTNGTTVDGSDAPIPPHHPVPLSDGTRIKLGAWTTITLKAP